MRPLPVIVISTLARAASDADAIGATHVLSIIDPDDEAPLVSASSHHIILRFHDVDCRGGSWQAPSHEMLSQIIAFARILTAKDRCLVHCHAGISRSPAAVLIMLAALTGSADEAVAELRAIEPSAAYDPNSLMIDLADHHLRLGGSLAAATDLIRLSSASLSADQIW